MTCLKQARRTTIGRAMVTGLFTIRDIKGKLLNVNVSKEGYFSSSQNDNRYFIFLLWRKT